jgi:hypothetical protein
MLVFATVILISVGDLLDPNRISETGIVVAGVPWPCDVFEVTKIERGRNYAGLRPGERFQLDDHRSAARLAIALGNGLPPGTPIHVTTLGMGRAITIVPYRQPTMQTLAHVSAVVVAILLELLALLILVWRGNTRAGLPAACAIVALIYASFNVSGAYLGVWYRIAFESVIEATAFAVAAVALVLFAIALVEWPRRLEKAFRVVTLCIAAVSVVVSCFGYVGLLVFGRTDFIGLIVAAKGSYGSAVVLLPAVIAFVISFALARGIARVQVGFTAIAAVLFAAQFLYSVRPESSSGAFPDDVLVVVIYCQIAGALGLAVAVYLLGLLDPSYRARVIAYGLAANLVVPVFIIVDYVVGKLINGSAGTRVLADLGTALVVGLLLQPIQELIHRWITKRKEALLARPPHETPPAS